MKIHPVFHVALLKQFIPNSFPGRKLSPPPPIVINDNSELEVNEILDMTLIHNQRYFLIKWKGYDSDENSWEPEDNLQNCQSLLRNFLGSPQKEGMSRT